MKEKLDQLINDTRQLSLVHTPVFYRLSKPKDQNDFSNLLNSISGLQVHDEVWGQLVELVKSFYPKKKLSNEELEKKITAHIGNVDIDQYGVWVYYPWSKRVIHILDEVEFIEVRTNRNQYKITKKEREILSRKSIGVIGLSVGQSVAVTMAMERVFGEIRLADYDKIELSNLNRIRTGLHNLEIPKVISVAREIAEIDPFLKVTCFLDGITKDNIMPFLERNKKLDILIDECDGLYVKILARQKAKQLGIPVVMEASDRGTIDIERFDIEPERPILHGFIDHLDHSKLKTLKTNEEKIPYLLPMVGIETMSNKLKASMMEVEESITTWPQLASDVTLGGGAVTDICRRIILKEFTSSGRYHLDVEELINDDKGNTLEKQDNKYIIKNKAKTSPLTGFDIDNYYEDISNHEIPKEETIAILKSLKVGKEKSQAAPTIQEIEELVTAGIFAPSGGNAQPWKWFFVGQELFAIVDVSRGKSYLNFNYLASCLALGAASENIILKSHELGYEISIHPFYSNKKIPLIINFKFYKGLKSNNMQLEPHKFDKLTTQIPIRLTNRMLSKRIKIQKGILDELKKMNEGIPHSEINFITEEKDLSLFGEIAAKMDRLLITNEKGHKSFMDELRWTKKENEITRDGVDINTVDLTLSEATGLKLAKNWSTVKYLNKWKGGSVFEKLSRKSVASASAIGLVSFDKCSKENFFKGGRIVERIWLNATKNNIAFQPLSVSVFLFTRLIEGNGVEMTEDMKKEMLEIREDFLKLFNLKARKEIFLFRLSMAKEPKIKSLRRPLEEVLHFG